MKIELLLDLDIRKLAEADEPLEILSREWELENEPTEATGLIKVLKRTMDACQRKGLRWPRVFLKRLGQLTRKEFEPRVFSSTTAPPQGVKFAVPKHDKVPREWLERATELENQRLRKKGPLN